MTTVSDRVERGVTCRNMVMARVVKAYERDL